MMFSKKEVLQFIPHRDPFLFIDSVESITLKDWSYGKPVSNSRDAVGGLITANFFVDESLPMFKGHFPGKPIFPGVVQVEAMAQASSFVMAFFIKNPMELKTLDVALARVESARFRRPVLPNTHLTIKSTIIKYRKPIMVTECQVFDGSDVVSEALISASVKF
jgi:3-hydroxyacyl-[acyl-carrier-protein] dehydratase